ncbi:MAG: SURF1 family protein [Betaproteobacteria bacterium]|nr:SURF1 family protein [Betaproteobacteria bacterium]
MARFFSGRTFRPTWWGVLLTAAGCAAFIALGNWQNHRAEEKRALQAQFEAALRAPAVELPPVPAAPADYVQRRVAARGEFLPKYTVLLEDKIYHGRVGYQVVTPLCQSGANICVLVNRGWVAAPERRDELPDVRTPSGAQRVEGLALARFPRALDPSGRRPTGRRWINVRVKDFEAWSGLALQPIVMEQLSPADDGLIRDWPRPDLHIEMNESYALQWYSFAALAVVLFVALSMRRREPAS